MPGLSQRAIRQLQYLFKRVQQLETQLKSGSVNTSTSGFNYLVRSPVDGIPAFDEANEIPGMASCEMVRRFSNHTDEDKRLADISTKQKVFNLGSFIPADELVLCARDCFGDLFVVPSDDPDTPFRNTIDFFPLSTDALRGSPLSILDATDDPTNSDLALGGSVSNLSAAVSTGTVSFLRNAVEADDGIEQQQKTNNGGITAAIVYVTHASHNYCVPDSKTGTNHRALISCPYGPWRIIKKVPLTELEASVPYYALATIKEQQYDRTIMKMDVSAIADLSGTPVKKTVEFSGHGVGEIDSALSSEYLSRFGYNTFTELNIGASSSSLGTVFTRSWFVEFAPSQLYLLDYYLQGKAQWVYDDTFVVVDNSPANQTFFIYPEKEMNANVYGRLNSGTWELIATEKVVLNFPRVVVGSALLENAWWSVHLTCPWIEKHKDVRIELEGGSGSLGSSITISDVGGYVLIHRLGDRGNFSGEGTRSWSSFSPGTIPDPVLEP